MGRYFGFYVGRSDLIGEILMIDNDRLEYRLNEPGVVVAEANFMWACETMAVGQVDLDSLAKILSKYSGEKFPVFSESLVKPVWDSWHLNLVALVSENWTSAVSRIDESNARDVAAYWASEIGLRDTGPEDIKTLIEAVKSLLRVCSTARKQGLSVVFWTGEPKK